MLCYLQNQHSEISSCNWQFLLVTSLQYFAAVNNRWVEHDTSTRATHTRSRSQSCTRSTPCGWHKAHCPRCRIKSIGHHEVSGASVNGNSARIIEPGCPRAVRVACSTASFQTQKIMLRPNHTHILVHTQTHTHTHTHTAFALKLPVAPVSINPAPK
jgi:hypothetical protein